MLLWKGAAGLLFIGLAVLLLFAPRIINGAVNLDSGTRNSFGALLLVYGIYRLATFYTEYNSLKDE